MLSVMAIQRLPSLSVSCRNSIIRGPSWLPFKALQIAPSHMQCFHSLAHTRPHSFLKSTHLGVSPVFIQSQEQSRIHCVAASCQMSRHYASNPDAKELGPVKRTWLKIARLIKAFMDGTKALYRDTRHMYELQKRSGGLVICKHAPTELAPGKLDFPFTRKEVQFMYQVSLCVYLFYGCITSYSHSFCLP